MVLTGLAWRGDQTRLGVGAVVLAVVGEDDTGASISRRLGDLALRSDVFIPPRAAGAERPVNVPPE